MTEKQRRLTEDERTELAIECVETLSDLIIAEYHLWNAICKALRAQGGCWL
jgi:hypothetical protein